MSTPLEVDRDKLNQLAEPFGDADVEWRIQRAGRSGDKVWAIILPYITNRAIQQRLDDVVGPSNWRNEYVSLPNAGHDAGCLCGLSIRIDGEWVTKWDGAQNTGTEGIKGGLSDAMKRAAVQWGMGRHLYGVSDNFAEVINEKNAGLYRTQVKIGDEKVWIDWNPPKLSQAKTRKRYAPKKEGDALRDEILGYIVRSRSAAMLDKCQRGVTERAQEGRLTKEHVEELEARILMERRHLQETAAA